MLFSSFVWRALPGLLLLLGSPARTRAQGPGAPARASIVTLSPAELFYKAQVGYEHRLGGRSSVGVLGTARYGMSQRYHGWQATGYYRRFLTRPYPAGLYTQVQASVFNFAQEASLYNPKNYTDYYFEYRGLGGGGGFGLGYRNYLLRRATQGRLLWNVLLGLRVQIRPAPDYDRNTYYPTRSFLGDSDAANWHLGFSPGSIAHGLLTLDYQF
jgi:hypothetical protein